MEKDTRNELKVQVIELGLDKLVSQANNLAFEYGDTSALNVIRKRFGFRTIKLANQVNSARYKRKQRVNDRIGSYIPLGECYFLTLTFTDSVLASTSPQTRRKYVSRWLKKNCVGYVANIDFGNDGIIKDYIDENGVQRVSTTREHYHAIAFGVHMDFSTWHKYGAIYSERIRCGKSNSKRVSAYVAKLSNHAMKVNNGIAPRMIYSRERKEIEKFFRDYF